jgi:hypothetical protein
MNVHLRASYTGILVGYKKVEQILDELEEEKVRAEKPEQTPLRNHE